MTHVARKGAVGILLAGGKSERMGADKALVDFAGAPMAAWCAAALAECAPTLLVSSADERHARQVARAVSGAWPKFTVLRGVQVEPVVDAVADRGPLAGLVAGLGARPDAPFAVVSACDTPLVPAEFYRRAASLLDGSPAVAPTLERPEPLTSAWRPGPALDAARPLLEEGRGPHRLLAVVGARLVGREELAAWGLDPARFGSANTPAALGDLLALARGAGPSKE